MKVLVTGGAGFIGSHLVEALLQRGDTVRVLDDFSSGTRENIPPTVEVITGCVTNPEIVTKALSDTDLCFHLAAIASVPQCRERWLASHRVNQSGLVNILDQARQKTNKVPVAYASSAAVYGNNENMPLKETAKPQPISGYGTDKYGCELQAKAGGLMYGQPTAGLRFFNVYGPRQNPDSPYSGVISRFKDRAAKGLPLLIHGDGKQVRDFIHVYDVVNALILAGNAAKATAPVYNVCTGHPTSILELAEYIHAASGHKANLSFSEARPDDVKASIGCPDLASQSLGFKAQRHIEKGLSTF